MQRKIILVVATLALAIGAYFLFSRDDAPVAKQDNTGAKEAVREFVQRIGEKDKPTMSAGANVKFLPGEHTTIRIHDQQTGKVRYVFEADEWQPLSDDRFDVRKLRIQSYMPRGEIAYISADQADVTVFHAGDNRFDPRRGKLSGNVRVIIDRTSEAWRVANPGKAARDDHPEELIHIDMESAQFDLDRSELISEGAVVVDSKEARIEEVADLTVRWDQMDNRLESLQFAKGGKMTIRRGANAVDLSLPGTEPESSGTPESHVAVSANQPMRIERARSDAPVSVAAVSAKEAAQQIRTQGLRVRTNQPVSLSVPKKLDAPKSDEAAPPAVASANAPETRDALRTTEELVSDVESIREEVRSGIIKDTEDMSPAELLALKKEPVFSYRAVFQGNVLVEQKRGEETVGTLKADQLEAHFDFGKRHERMMRADGDPAATTDDAKADKPEDEKLEGNNAIVLVWNGPFELHPLQMEPEKQTGKRFDIVATGEKVEVQSDRGGATCRQLVFRNEAEQIWLSGAGKQDVSVDVGEGRKLVGGEVFFDRHRGLARVDGAGYMLDKRTAVGREALAAAFTADTESVEIHWQEAVDVELGSRIVTQKNEQTGAMDQKQRPYLRRAWFHGDVRFRRGDEMARANEVAATFGPPVTAGAVADYIEHLDLSGDVVVANHQHFVQAMHLDVELIRTPEGRNIPRRVRGNGRVMARQVRGEGSILNTPLRREIRADEMDVRVQEFAEPAVASAGAKTPVDDLPIGIESLDAVGSVEVRDPDHNLKISRTQSMRAVFKGGDALETLTLVSPSPDVLAQARVEDVAVHGHRIDINVSEQSLDIPGPGKAWMVTRQDFGGRTLATPQPVKATWRDQMQLRLSKDYGVFVGDVRIRMEGFAMNSDKLTVRFADAPPVAKDVSPKLADRFGILGDFLDGEPKVEWTDRIASNSRRKRPVYIVAEGNAEAMSNTNAPGADPTTPGRLLSRAHIAGTQIVADLEREQLSVPSAGTLLIEDYQFDANSRRPTAAATRGVGGPMMSSIRSDGPSQTLVSWQQGMDFFLQRAMVVFDRDVNMIHCSGRQMVLKDELLESMGMSSSLSEQLKPGRKATLTCRKLMLEFATSNKPIQSANDASGRATDLRRMLAQGAIHLQEGEWSLMGSQLQYMKQTEEVRLDGGDGVEARIMRQRADDGGFNMWRGDYLIWNRSNNRVEAPNARVTSG